MIRPLNDWILVKLMPIEHQVGSIFLPEGVDFRKATVISTGPGAENKKGKRMPTGVEPGEHVLFNRAHGEHKQGKQLIRELGEDMLLLQPEDILLVFDGELTVT